MLLTSHYRIDFRASQSNTFPKPPDWEASLPFPPSKSISRVLAKTRDHNLPLLSPLAGRFTTVGVLHPGTDWVCHHTGIADNCGRTSVVYLESPILFKIIMCRLNYPLFPQHRLIYIFIYAFWNRMGVLPLPEVEVLHRGKIMWERAINFY